MKTKPTYLAKTEYPGQKLEIVWSYDSHGGTGNHRVEIFRNGKGGFPGVWVFTTARDAQEKYLELVQAYAPN